MKAGDNNSELSINSSSELNIVHSNIPADPVSEIIISPRRILQMLFAVIAFLVVASLATLVVRDFLDQHSKSANLFFRLFNLDKEANIPSLFSSMELMLASLLLFLISLLQKMNRGYWLFLSAVFLFLSIDETAQIHEIIINLKSRFELLNESNMRNVWVFPYFLAVLILAIALAKFVFALPAKTRNLFIISGFIFVGGAVGIEVLEEQLKILNGGSESLTLKLLYHLEELCEMCGVAIFIYALLNYLPLNNSKIAFSIKE